MTLKTRVIACLDIDNGVVVKGRQFSDIIKAGNPVELAKHYNDTGADELCLLDITASSQGRNALYSTIESVARECSIPFSVGGGIRSLDDARKILNCGADKVCIGTSAVSKPELVSEIASVFGRQCVIVSIDAKRSESDKYTVYIKGGREDSEIPVMDFVWMMEQIGAGEILLNSIGTDGMKSGFDNHLNKLVSSVVKIPVIASGGAGAIEDFIDAVQIGGVSAVLAASVFHFNELTITQVKNGMAAAGLSIRAT